MNKNTKKAFAVFISVLIVFSGCGETSAIKKKANTNGTESNEQKTNLDVLAPKVDTSPNKTAAAEPSKAPNNAAGDNLPVSRGLVAKMLALAFNDSNTVDILDREIQFSDTDVMKWYDKYINAAYIQGVMSGTDEGKFLPADSITMWQAQLLLDKLDPKNKIKMEINDANKDKPISYALWTELYKKLLTNLSGNKSVKEVFGIDEKNIIILATSGNNSQLAPYNMITDKETLGYSGLNLDAYIDKEIRILKKDSEIIAVLSLVNKTPTIKNAYVTAYVDGQITIFSGGAERTYSFNNAVQEAAGNICDIKINGNQAEEVVFYSEKMADTMKKTTEKEIVFENKGTMNIAENFKVYSVADGAVKWKGLNDLLVGTDIADFIVDNNQIISAIIKKKWSAGTLRVAISTTNFDSLAHDKISLTADTDYVVTAGAAVKNYNKGQVITFSSSENKDLFGAGSVTITPTGGGKIEIKTIKRNWTGDESPKYRGSMEILKADKGFHVVNEIDIEEYLYAVVPSEMPSSHGVEASKVQAITARSYAYNQFYANRFHKYGANIDDSVSCQVYNNIPENETAIKAVSETKGKCLTYKGDVISANFFSTSSGMTANDGEVWASSVNKQFPTATSAYLIAKKQYSGTDFGDLKIEENADKFLRATDIDSYDSGFSWFRWNVEMSAAEVAASINANIKDRYTANPQLIKTLQSGNAFRSREIDTVGDVKDLEIVKRGAGGNIMQMKVTGTKATVLINTEYNARALIRPFKYIKNGRDIVTYRKDGTEINNYSIMPSAFYVMEKTKDANGNLSKVKFIGGGNGHGAGMSQNGVKGMIDKGFGFEEILLHYYDGTEIHQMI